MESQHFEIIYMRPDDLTPYANNAKIHTDEQIEKLAGAIAAWGFDQPITVDANHVIIKGHGRREAALRLNLDLVPVIITDHLDEHQVMAARIADNKLASLEYDNAKLAFDVGTLERVNFDLNLTGLGFEEVKTLLSAGDLSVGGVIGGNPGKTDPDQVPEAPPRTNVKFGDIYQLGNHRLMCGDSTDAESVAQLMNGEQAEICFTSPPYNLGENMKLRGPNASGEDSAYLERTDHKTQEEYLEFLKTFTDLALANAQVSFINIQMLAGNKVIFPKYWGHYGEHLVDIMIWDKEHGAPAMAPRVLNSVWEFIFIFAQEHMPKRSIKTGPEFRGNKPNIYRLNPVGKKDPLAKDHGAVFPVQFVQHFLENFSSVSVLDLFGGSGTTMIAAEKVGRKSFLMELDPFYAFIILRRWAEFTGEEPMRVEGERLIPWHPDAERRD